MNLLAFIRRASPFDLSVMVALTLVAGLANAGLVVMVNRAAAIAAIGDRPTLLDAGLFVTAFALYYFCNRVALLRANDVIERLLRDLRLQMIDKLRNSELETVDTVGRGQLYHLISNETNHLSVAFPLIVDSVQQAALLLVSLVYLAWLSSAAFCAFVFAVGAGVLAYRRINAEFAAPMALGQQRQGDVLDRVGDIVDGFKELRLNMARRRAVGEAFAAANAAVDESRDAAGQHWAALFLLNSFTIYLLLGVVGLILPGYLLSQGRYVFQLIPTLLFCMTSLGKIVAQLPMFQQAQQGLAGILNVQRRLDAGGATTPEEARAAAVFGDFQRIDYLRLQLTRRDETGAAGFSLGPLDLTLNRGETVFLVGGNGSGKSTVARLCAGLLRPDSGEILIDGRRLDRRAIAGFRELFSAVFTDFHLFDRLYGLDRVDPARVNALLVEMKLAHKVRFEDGRFGNIDLSTGQRKRLGLVVALLEDRPIVVFDEWSADQDAEFREYFYMKTLAQLRAQGKTCLIVTHDERYWPCADRVIALDLGAIDWERSFARDAAPSGAPALSGE
jgi:putative pyoverdin transport system ATP-binding/permease protein